MQTRPNILLLITDQHRADHLGCYGNRTVRTPHIDGLAQRGTLFERFYVASAICMPNRATLMTGRMPSLHGVRHNGIPLSLNATVFPELMRAAGYRTALIGKSHLQNMTASPPLLKAAAVDGGASPLFSEADHIRREGPAYDQEREDRWADPDHEMILPFYGFEHVELCDGHGDETFGHYSRWLKARAPEADRLRGRKNAIPTQEITVPQAWRTRLPVELYPTSYIAERAEAYLAAAAKAAPQAPFFLACSFPDPHHPFTPPGRYWDMYDPAAVAAPATCRPPDEDAPPPVKWLHAERQAGKANVNTPRVIAIDEREAREAIALTYGMISLIDDAVGRILAALDRGGMAERTLVIFTSDHGDFMGDHGLLFKHPLHYQGLIRTPFLWVEPEERALPRCGALAGTLDVARSVLSRVGIAPYNGLQGVDLAPLMRGADPVRQSMLIEEDSQRIFGGFEAPVRCRTLITEHWRLTLYAGVAWGELYDLREDPGETRNLWSDAAAGTTKAALIEALARKLVETCDHSPLPTGLA